jgi:hypothetical protein
MLREVNGDSGDVRDSRQGILSRGLAPSVKIAKCS